MSFSTTIFFSVRGKELLSRLLLMKIAQQNKKLDALLPQKEMVTLNEHGT